MSPTDEGGKGSVEVGSLADFPEGTGVPVTIGSRKLVIYRQGGELFALKDICPHMGDALHRRKPEKGAAVCPGHGWRFDLRTGRCIYGDPEARVAVYPVILQGDKVLVNLER